MLVQQDDQAMMQFSAGLVRTDAPSGDNGGLLVTDFAGQLPIAPGLEDDVLGLEPGEPALALIDLEIPASTIGGLQLPDSEIGRSSRGAHLDRRALLIEVLGRREEPRPSPARRHRPPPATAGALTVQHRPVGGSA